MTFYINFEVIPRTISGKNSINEDQSFCAQSQKIQEQIRNYLESLGADIKSKEKCVCVGFEGYNSRSWNRTLPTFIKENYGITYWPLIWPEHLIEKSEFDLSFKNRKTGEIDILYFQKVIKVAPSTKKGKEEVAVVILEEGKEDIPTPKRTKENTSTDWKTIRDKFPEHKWVKTGNSDY